MGDKTEEDSEVERLIQMRENLLAELDNASEGGSLSSSSAAQESAKNTTETLLNVLPERVSPNSSQYNSQSVNEAVENISFIVNNEKSNIVLLDFCLRNYFQLVLMVTCLKDMLWRIMEIVVINRMSF